MPALSSFTDFIVATDEKQITPSTDILNEAVKNTYMLKEALKGRGNDRVLQNGKKLFDIIQLEDNGSFMFYEPNQEFNPTVVDTLTKISINWRFGVAHYGYNEETMDLQEGDEVQYKKLKKSYEQAAHTSMFNGKEDAIWALPSASGMEADAGKIPYSIPAFIDEIGTDHHWPGFTTLMTVDPALEDRWRNQIATYDSANRLDAEDGILPAMDDIWLSVKFVAPETNSEYFENQEMSKQKILTNKDGVNNYKKILRALNDRTINPTDAAYTNITYSGVPVKYISSLDTALLDQEAAVTGTPGAWAAGSPRYYFLNLSYMFPIWHKDKYMTMKGPVNGGIKQPFSYVVFFKTYYNWFCRSRQRQGIVTPVGFGA